MFSSRLDWSVEQNPISTLLQQMRSSGATILDLTESNPTAAGLDYPAGAITDALSDPRLLNYSPDPAGLAEAREAVSQYYGRRASTDRILLTASTSEAYAYLFKLLANPGDEVLVPRPSYPLFGYLAALESVSVIEYPLVYDTDWRIDFDGLRSRITSRTRAIVLVNPNNPTGSFLKKPELARLVRICLEHDLALISDEVFADYGFAPDPGRQQSLVDVDNILTFSMSGLSKVAGLPQMKLGWIVCNGPEVLRKLAFDRLELIADTYLSVGTPVQWAATALFCLREAIQRQIQHRTRGNLDFLKRSISGDSPWSVLNVEGGWYATLQAPRIHSEEEWVLSLLSEDHVYVQPGFFFDFETEAFLVVSLLTQPETFQLGIQRILARA